MSSDIFPFSRKFVFFFFNFQAHEGIMVFLSWKNNFLLEKIVGMWVAPLPFARSVRRHLVVKPVI
jgi:hypothetical protein